MTINRQEQKFFVKNLEISFILKELNMQLQHRNRQINSIYFDDTRMNDFIDSEEGSVKRSKIRYRWYGNKDEVLAGGNLELKSTYSNFRTKKSWSINDPNTQFLIEKIFKLTDRHVAPKCQISYMRDYFYNLSGTRVTLDRQILFKPFETKVFYLMNENVLEIKYNSPEVSRILSKFSTNVTRFSKYCEAIKRLYDFYS